jgi:phosphate transport system substrate-binding protein
MLQRGAIDWAASDFPLSSFGLPSFPIAAFAVVVAYNVPEVSALSSAILLSRSNLVAIFTGNISVWNDARLVADNPQLFAVSHPIQVVVRADGSGTTFSFTSALEKMSPDWPFGKIFKWGPANSQSTWIFAQNSVGVASLVRSRPYSLSYVSQTWASVFDLPYAQLVNQAGNIVSSPNAALDEVIEQAFIDQPQALIAGGLDLTDSGVSNAWPLCTLHYAAVSNASFCNTNVSVPVLKFIRWILVDRTARALPASLFIFPIPVSIVPSIVSYLASFTCSGASVFSVTTVDFASQGAFIAMRAFGIISILSSFCVFLLMVFLFVRTGGGALELVFLTCFEIGCFGLGVCAVLWSQLPLTGTTCTVQAWLLVLALAELVATCFGRLVQVVVVWKKSRDAALKEGQYLGLPFALCFCSVVAVALVVLIVWTTAASGWGLVSVVLNEIDWTQQNVCWSSNFVGWFVSLLIFVGAMALANAVLLLFTWKINPGVGESRWIFTAMYSVLVCVVVIAISLVQSSSASAYPFFAQVVGWTSAFMSFVWIPLYVSKIKAFHSASHAVHVASPPSLALPATSSHQQLSEDGNERASVSMVRFSSD